MVEITNDGRACASQNKLRYGGCSKYALDCHIHLRLVAQQFRQRARSAPEDLQCVNAGLMALILFVAMSADLFDRRSYQTTYFAHHFEEGRLP
jgi:hypothetical protein